MRLLIIYVARPPRLIMKVAAPFPQAQERTLFFLRIFYHDWISFSLFPLVPPGRTLVVGWVQITCLYDMDIVFGPDGNFDEVYLYEELMEADLHAIVRRNSHSSSFHSPLILAIERKLLTLNIKKKHSIDPLRPTALGRALPVLHIPNALRSEVHPLGRRAASRSQAGQPARERGLRAQDLRFRTRPRFQPGAEAGVHDRIRRYAVVSRT